MKPRVLFLDDCEHRQARFRSNCPSAKIVATAKEAIDALESTDEFDVVFLDHDLGGEVYCDSDREDTGMEVARWLAANSCSVKEVVVHTLNPGAAVRMVGLLALTGRYSVIKCPFIYFDDQEIYATVGL